MLLDHVRPKDSLILKEDNWDVKAGDAMLYGGTFVHHQGGQPYIMATFLDFETHMDKVVIPYHQADMYFRLPMGSLQL